MSSIDEFAIPNTILRHFDLSSTPWNEFTIPDIEGRRKNLPDGKLFFDRLLELVGLDGKSLYPPNTPAALRRLLHSIHTLELDRLKKDCFLFYLLKDYDASSDLTNGHPGMDIDDSIEEGDLTIITKTPNGNSGDSGSDGKAAKFAKKRCMSKTWLRFMDGYWALDHGLWEAAVSSLSDPSITTLNFIPSILQTLSQQVSPPSLSLTLIHNFLISTHSELTTREENDIRLIALASSGSLSQAFSLIRSNDSEEERKRNRENLWLWLLGSPRISCGKIENGSHQIQSGLLKELLHIPLSSEENSHLIEFLKRPPIRNIQSNGLSLLNDLITLRLIHQGQYSDSLLLDKSLSTSSNGEEQIKNQQRREMVREFISILPKVQRNALVIDVESKKDDSRVNGNSDEATRNGQGEDTDMSNSWVTVQSNGPSYAEIASEPPSIPIPSIVPEPSTIPSSAPAPLPIRSSIPPVASPVLAPTPIRPSNTHTSLFNASQNTTMQSSPQKPSSPFSGPPRFAPGSSSTQSPGRRVLSGSPFNLPISSSSSSNLKLKGSPAHSNSNTMKLPKTIINDDDDDMEEESVLGRRNIKSLGRGKPRGRGRGISESVEPEIEKGNHEGPNTSVEHNHSIGTISEEPSSSKSKSKNQPEPPKSVRRSKRVVSGQNSHTQSQSRSETTPPPPSGKSSNNEPITPGINDMPGSFNPPPNSSYDEEMPPPQSTTRNTKSTANLPESVKNKGKSRITRSASRSILDEEGNENQTPGPPSKKPKQSTTKRNVARSSLAPSEITDDSFNGSVRRSTRSRASTVQPSEQGSPTPSEISVGGRKRSTRGGSATPRMSTRNRRG